MRTTSVNRKYYIVALNPNESFLEGMFIAEMAKYTNDITYDQKLYHKMIIQDPMAYTDCHLQNILLFVHVACYHKFCHALSIKPKYLSISNGFALVELFFKCVPLYQYLQMTYFVNYTHCEK